jgi:hypothetical protein
MSDPSDDPKAIDDHYANRAIERLGHMKTVPEFWGAVDAMRDRRRRMHKEASARIKVALHQRFEALTGRRLNGSKVERKEAA